MKGENRRKTVLFLAISMVLLLLLVAFLGYFWEADAMQVDFSRKNLAPCSQYWFGTDWLGRDMAKRTVAGLSVSIRLGAGAAFVSACISLLFAFAAAMGGEKADAFLSWLTDLVMGIPHILLLILISYAFGKGEVGVSVGLALTHWPSLARLLRAEILQLKQAPYIQIAEKMGLSPTAIAVQHMLPHLFSQFVTGLILMFPHAILHEASVTFLGFGLSPEKPAIGIILSESMNYLMTGKWWLAFFPGAALVAVILLFEGLGRSMSSLLSPGSVHE